MPQHSKTLYKCFLSQQSQMNTNFSFLNAFSLVLFHFGFETRSHFSRLAFNLRCNQRWPWIPHSSASIHQVLGMTSVYNSSWFHHKWIFYYLFSEHCFIPQWDLKNTQSTYKTVMTSQATSEKTKDMPRSSGKVRTGSELGWWPVLPHWLRNLWSLAVASGWALSSLKWWGPRLLQWLEESWPVTLRCGSQL